MRARQAAGAAYKLARGQPVIMDSLGGYCSDRAIPSVLSMPRQASVQAPQVSDIRLHLSMGLDKAGDTKAARKELESLVTNAGGRSRPGDA